MQEEYKSKIGICTSKINNDQRMWGHYGDKNKGICIGLKLPNLTNFGLFGMNVKYTNNIIPLKLNGTQIDIIPILHWIFTKSIDWQYEDEVRFVLLKHSGLISFDAKSIKELYYGINVNKVDENKIENLILQKNIILDKKGQMQKKIGEFGFEIKYY